MPREINGYYAVAVFNLKRRVLCRAIFTRSWIIIFRRLLLSSREGRYFRRPLQLENLALLSTVRRAADAPGDSVSMIVAQCSREVTHARRRCSCTRGIIGTRMVTCIQGPRAGSTRVFTHRIGPRSFYTARLNPGTVER